MNPAAEIQRLNLEVLDLESALARRDARIAQTQARASRIAAALESTAKAREIQLPEDIKRDIAAVMEVE